MQVDPIKPTLKAPATMLLKLKCGELLSRFSFKFNLRRYTKGRKLVPRVAMTAPSVNLWAGAHTRPLFSSTCAVCVTDKLTPPSVSHEKCLS